MGGPMFLPRGFRKDLLDRIQPVLGSRGTRLFPKQDPVITEQATLDAQRALNDELRARADVLQAALDGAVCRADGVLILPNGQTPEGLLPPKQGEAFPQTASRTK